VASGIDAVAWSLNLGTLRIAPADKQRNDRYLMTAHSSRLFGSRRPSMLGCIMGWWFCPCPMFFWA